MADSAPDAVHEPLPETDWLSEFPSEDEMDSAWSQRPATENPFDFFAQEDTAAADVPLLRPVAEPPAAAIDPAIRIVDAAPIAARVAVADRVVAPAAGARRPRIAATALAAAVLAAALFFLVPRTITTPELPPQVVPPIAAAPSTPALVSTPPPDAPIAPAPEPPRATAPPVNIDVERPNRGASAQPAPPTPPPSRPAPAAVDTTAGTPQRPPPPPPPALALSPAPGPPPIGSVGTKSVVVAPPPDLPLPPSAASRPPSEPGRGANSGAGTASPSGARAPAVVDPALTLAAESAAIDVVLGGYRRAFNALDVERVEQVWPAVDRRALERAFRGLAKQTFEFESCDVRPNGTDAHAICSGRASYVPKVGGRATQAEARQWVFTLTKQSGRWLIASVESKR